MLAGRARLLSLATICLFFSFAASAPRGVFGVVGVGGQKRQEPKRTLPAPRPEPTREPAEETESQDIDTVKIDTNLVLVPVIATGREGLYVADLQQSDFSLSEDGAKQEIAFFATVSAPFHVALMLDTSASTQEKLGVIQRAAAAFVDQLQNADRVKVISFDDKVRDLNEFTNDRAAVRTAIYKTRSGEGTKLYDAMELALNSIRQVRGRKAIVIFTDGVDYHSDSASFDGTLRYLDEEGVIVYPIRYDTRAETERLAREQAGQGPQLPTIGSIGRMPPGTTAPTFPGDGSTVPTTGTRNKTGPFGLPLPDEILRRRQGNDPNQNRLPSDGIPPSRDPTRWPDSRNDTSDGRGPKPSDDSISRILEPLYRTADSYLKELADKTGGRLVRADSLSVLPGAFAQIAGELRTQYSIGYYPLDKTRDDRYRKIKVTSTRKNVIIRARPGYRPARL